MPTRHDDILGKLIRDVLRRRVAGVAPREDLWDHIQGRLDEEAPVKPERRLAGIWIDPAARLAGLLRAE